MAWNEASYVQGHHEAEDTIRAQLTEPIDALEDGLAREYLTQPMREALEALKRFRDALPL